MILEPRKIKSATVSTVSPSICHEVMGPDARPLEKVLFFFFQELGSVGVRKFSFGHIKGKMLTRHPNADVE